MEESFNTITGFLWDSGNRDKNLRSHKVTNEECEEPFFNQPLVTGADEKHSDQEERHYLLGQTNVGRLLFIVYTIRSNHIRIISARDMNKNERKIYGQYN